MVQNFRPEYASDEALVARVAEGDRQAIALLFARHQQRVYRFVLRLVGNSATAEDIVSEVFFDLWRQAASFEGRARLSTWLLAIARNKALSAMRGRARSAARRRRGRNNPGSGEHGRRSHWKQASGGALLRQCLGQLSPAHREIIDLVYYHEKSVDEVATISRRARGDGEDPDVPRPQAAGRAAAGCRHRDGAGLKRISLEAVIWLRSRAKPSIGRMTVEDV